MKKMSAPCPAIARSITCTLMIITYILKKGRMDTEYSTRNIYFSNIIRRPFNKERQMLKILC